MADGELSILMLEEQFEEEPPEPPTKKLIGLFDKCTQDSVEGFVAVNYGLRILDKYWAVVREDLQDLKGKVAVVGGAPAGHEPYAIGFVGKGMLAGAVAGGVFVAAGVLHAQKLFRHIAAAQPSGILVIVANSAGQKLSLTHSVDTLRAEGVSIELFICGDDSINTKGRVASRRGLVGTVYMMKIAGAMAQEGYSLRAISDELEVVANMLGTIGLNMTQCSFPGKPPSYHIPEDTVELGSGLHGEAGIQRIPLVNIRQAVGWLLTHMIDYENLAGLHLAEGHEVALIVNNMGVMTYMEELIVCKQVIADLERVGVRVLRAYHGRLVTALDMSGVFIALMRLSPLHGRKERWLRHLDTHTDAPAWPAVVMSETSPDRFSPDPVEPPDAKMEDEIKSDVFVIELDTRCTTLFADTLKSIYRAIRKREAYLNELDAVAGDGDCGTNLTRGLHGILDAVRDGKLDLRHPRVALSDMSDIWSSNADGASGGLYGLLFSGAARAIHKYEKNLLKRGPASRKTTMFPKPHQHLKMWVDGLETGVESIVTYGGARQGERTMLDALIPALKVLKRWSGDPPVVQRVLAVASNAAQRGAAKTSRMILKPGMSNYVNPENFTQPDPGALAVSIWLKAISDMVAVSLAATAPSPHEVDSPAADNLGRHDRGHHSD